jgi:hypothetical protein
MEGEGLEFDSTTESAKLMVQSRKNSMKVITPTPSPDENETDHILLSMLEKS